MAFKGMVLGCDWCQQEAHEFMDDEEAAEEGWWFMLGKTRNGVKELAFCDEECRDNYTGYHS